MLFRSRGCADTRWTRVRSIALLPWLVGRWHIGLPLSNSNPRPPPSSSTPSHIFAGDSASCRRLHICPATSPTFTSPATFFFHNFLCDSDDSSFDDKEEILIAVLVHHHLNNQRPLFRGSIPSQALNRNRESRHFLLWKDYFDTTNLLFKH